MFSSVKRIGKSCDPFVIRSAALWLPSESLVSASPRRWLQSRERLAGLAAADNRQGVPPETFDSSNARHEFELKS